MHRAVNYIQHSVKRITKGYPKGIPVYTRNQISDTLRKIRAYRIPIDFIDSFIDIQHKGINTFGQS